jgi:cation diffusion facilitator family transporter
MAYVMNNESAVKEKKKVALVSVLAAVFLTASKAVIGVLTGSLGILAEALHSGLDLLAALITYFSVRISDRPADSDHHFGHGKIENLSALIETILLLITCAWIIYEAIHRLLTGRVHIEVTYWSYIVVVTSIVIDFSRSRALMKAARKHNSQALEADAIHFSTDIWSSAVVLLGLICANIGWHYADAIAALVVAAIVIYVCFRLGKSAISVLLDRAPEGMLETIYETARQMPEITTVHDVRIRNAGADVFVDMSIHVDGKLTIDQAHEISHRLEDELHRKIKRCSVHVHQEPEVEEGSGKEP